MLSPAQSKRLDRLLELHHQGFLTQEELGEHLNHLVTADNVADMIPRIPASAVESLKKEIAANAQDAADAEYLRPEESPFSEYQDHFQYYLLVAKALFKPTEPFRIDHATVICLPSFEPEWALRLGGPRLSRCSLLLVEAEQKIGGAKLTTTPVWQTEVAVSDELIDSICEVWRKMLSRTRHPRAMRIGFDGVGYHFGCWDVVAGHKAGRTWSPNSESAPGHLVAVSRLLREYVRSAEPERAAVAEQVRQELEWFKRLT